MWKSLLSGWRPERRKSSSWSELFPRQRMHLASSILLLVVFFVFLILWAQSNKGTLFDPWLQNDDARTHLFAFHRFGPEKLLADDSVADELISLAPPFFKDLYAVIVPRVGLYRATKYVQMINIGLIAAATIILVRSRRGGLAAGLLLAFFMLNTPYITDRLAGGLQRNFAFPAFALWAAGALSRKESVRWLAIILGALTYPSAMVIMMGAEALFIFRYRLKLNSPLVRNQLKRIIVLAAICLVCILVFQQGQTKTGPILTMTEAKANRALYEGGRTTKLPLPDTVNYMSHHFFSFFNKRTDRLLSGPFFSGWTPIVGFIIFPAVILLMIMGRISPKPSAAAAFGLSTILAYLAAVVLALRLYFPQRYAQYGLPFAALLLTQTAFGQSWWYIRERGQRATRRNFMAAAVILFFVTFLGADLAENRGMVIDGRKSQELMSRIRQLPMEARLAGHPNDLDPVPFWGGRAVLTSYETLVPWMKKLWQAQRERTLDTLQALYADRPEEVLAFCQKYGISHLLLNMSRYKRNFRIRAAFIEPFTSLVAKKLNSVTIDDLVLANLPEQAVLYRHGTWRLVSISRLRRIWLDEDFTSNFTQSSELSPGP